MASLLEWQDLAVSKLSKTRSLSVEDIITTVKAYYRRIAGTPTQKSGEVLDGPLKGDQWANINTAIRHRYRELDQAGLPDEVVGLGSFLEWQGLKNGASKNISVEGIDPTPP